MRYGGDGDGVRHGVDRINVESGIKIHRDGDVVAGAVLWVSNDGSDPGCVRHGVRVVRPSGAPVSGRLRSWDVAWANDHGKNNAHASGFPVQWFYIAQSYVDVVAGHDIGNRSGKDVWPLLFHQ